VVPVVAEPRAVSKAGADCSSAFVIRRITRSGSPLSLDEADELLLAGAFTAVLPIVPVVAVVPVEDVAPR
jgi:hypothetical protein